MQDTLYSIMQKAQEAISKNEKVNLLIANVSKKLQSVTFGKKYLAGLIEYVNILSSMLIAHVKGEYSAFSSKTIFTIVFGLVYFLTPADFIPDIFPLIGFSDDISVIYYIIKLLQKDIVTFQAWKKKNSVEKVKNN